MKNGAEKRWNWRTKHRIGPNAWQMNKKQVAKVLRRFSWRRAL